MAQVTNLLDALYLIVIALSTVGYGDIVPKSALGRVAIMVLIVGAIIIIPQELAKLIRIFSSSRTWLSLLIWTALLTSNYRQ